MRIGSIVGSAAVIGLLAASASAQVFSFNYQNLDSRYVPGTGPGSGFSARAAAGPALVNTHGAVSTNIAPNVETNFNVGFFGGSAADFRLNLNVVNTGGAFASGFGGFTITDADGDTITGDIAGDKNIAQGWNQSGPALFFRGTLENVRFNQKLGGLNTLWNGTDGDSFDWTSLGGPIFSGNLIQLSFNTIGGGVPWFYTYTWGNGTVNQNGIPNGPVPTGLNAFLIPAPGAMALVGLGGLVAVRRRR